MPRVRTIGAFALALALLLSFPVVAAQGSTISIELQPSSLELPAGASGSVTLRVTNSGTAPSTVNVTARNATGGVFVGVPSGDITVLPGQPESVHLSVRGNVTGNWSVEIHAQERSVLGASTANRAQAILRVQIRPAVANQTTGTPPPGGRDNSTSPPANTTSPPANSTNATQPPPEPAPSAVAWVVDATPIDLETAQGESASFAIAIQNPENATAVVNVTLRLPLGWGGALDAQVLSIPPNDIAHARGRVTPTASARDADATLIVSDAARSESVVLRLRIGPSPPSEEEAPIVTPVAETTLAPSETATADASRADPRRPILRVQPNDVAGAPGTTILLEIVLDNPSESAVSADIRVTLLGLASQAASREIVAMAHASATVTLTVSIPDDALVGATHVGEVATDLAGVATAEFRILIAGTDREASAPAVEGRESDARIALAVGAAGLGAAALAGAALWRRWPGLGLFALYARLAPRRALEHPRREAMLALVRAEPGLTLADVQRRLALSNGVARHHVALLQSAGLVRRSHDGARRRLWPIGAAIVAAPSLGERAVTLVEQRGPMRAAEIADALGVSRQSLHYHLKRLEADGRLVARREGGELVLMPVAS